MELNNYQQNQEAAQLDRPSGLGELDRQQMGIIPVKPSFTAHNVRFEEFKSSYELQSPRQWETRKRVVISNVSNCKTRKAVVISNVSNCKSHFILFYFFHFKVIEFSVLFLFPGKYSSPVVALCREADKF